MPAQSLEPIWNGITDELRREVPDFKFHIWFEPLELAGIADNTLYVRSPDHIRSRVEERYLPLLRRAAARRFDPQARVRIVAMDWTEPVSPAGSGGGLTPLPPLLGLKPRYSFEQFVIGEGNRFAHAAALAVAELPGQAYNPLFLHGRPGLGKTHLLHAIGNYIVRFGSGLRVRYATIDEFTSEFVEAVRERRTAAFRESFRRADLVLIDDVQFLARKERTREEFFHTFNALIDSGRQLVLTSDRSPDELPELEARLAERFRSGLVVELDSPSLSVRRAILTARARLDGLEVPPEVVSEIAERVASSVRALEGALIRVVAYASLQQAELTPGLVREVLERLGTGETPARCGITEILDATSSEFSVRREDLIARSRRPDVARARQVAMYLARELTEHSLPEIGRGIGNRNHTTVLHAVNSISAAVQSDDAVRNSVDKLRRRLGGRVDGRRD